MAENNNSTSARIQKRINHLAELRDKLIEKNGGLTEPQYSWLAKNDSSLVKGIRNFIKKSGAGEIKERWGDTSLSRPDMPFATMGNGLTDKGIGAAMFNPVTAAIDWMPAFARGISGSEFGVWRLAPEALLTLRAWARNGKNYLYDLQKQQGGAGREYNQYIKALDDIDRNLDVLGAYRDDAKAVESEGKNYVDELENAGYTQILDYINSQISDSALGDELLSPETRAQLDEERVAAQRKIDNKTVQPGVNNTVAGDLLNQGSRTYSVMPTMKYLGR